MTTPIISVSDINTLIKTSLETDPLLHNIWIQGEISNVKVYALGKQVYFNLIDGQSQLNCVMYQPSSKKCDFDIKNGVSVQAKGKLTVFHKRGTYSLQVGFMKVAGKGKINTALDALKNKLHTEGLFDKDRKKPLPLYPKTIGLITAVDSAAMHDAITIIKQDAPHLKIQVFPAIVQGEKSEESLCSALTHAQKKGTCDTLVLLRGGGSSEDLASFNSEKLVRQLSTCPIPTISAIGHDIDITLCDFVADERAATPTDAAKRLTAPFIQLISDLHHIIDSQFTQITHRLSQLLTDINQQKNYSTQLIHHKHDQTTQLIHQLLARVEAANPLNKFKQGYSMTLNNETNTAIKHINDINKNVQIKTQLWDGYCISKVTSIIKENYEY